MLGLRGVLFDEPIDGGDHFLHFVTDDVPAHFVSRAVNPLAMGLVSHLDSGNAGPCGRAVYQDRYQHLTSALRKPAGKLRRGVDTQRQVVLFHRWGQSATGALQRFYVVLKVFSGFSTCASQPDSWHQYGPAVAESHQVGYSFTISPGFWRIDEASSSVSPHQTPVDG